MNRLIREEMDFQQRRFYRRLKLRDKLVVEFWPGAKKFFDSIPGIAWEKQGNKILIKEKTNTMKTFRDILKEGVTNTPPGWALMNAARGRGLQTKDLTNLSDAIDKSKKQDFTLSQWMKLGMPAMVSAYPGMSKKAWKEYRTAELEGIFATARYI